MLSNAGLRAGDAARHGRGRVRLRLHLRRQARSGARHVGAGAPTATRWRSTVRAARNGPPSGWPGPRPRTAPSPWTSRCRPAGRTTLAVEVHASDLHGAVAAPGPTPRGSLRPVPRRHRTRGGCRPDDPLLRSALQPARPALLRRPGLADPRGRRGAGGPVRRGGQPVVPDAVRSRLDLGRAHGAAARPRPRPRDAAGAGAAPGRRRRPGDRGGAGQDPARGPARCAGRSWRPPAGLLRHGRRDAAVRHRWSTRRGAGACPTPRSAAAAAERRGGARLDA